MLRSGSVVVITGASDGIGKAAAIEFAREKSRLVLIARNEDKLNETKKQCEALGAECMVVRADMQNREDVRNALNEAIKRFQRIDVWINNAGVAAIGRFNRVPLEDHENVLKTNVIGYFNGAYVALEQFKKQNSGTLINNASICSCLTIPNMTSYNASKFAIRGFTLTLRQELWMDGLKDIHVCLLNPSIVDTKVFEHSGNFTGSKMKLKFPKTTPEQVAVALKRLVERPTREAFVGPFGRLGVFGYTVLPAFTGMILAWFTTRYFFGESKEILRR